METEATSSEVVPGDTDRRRDDDVGMPNGMRCESVRGNVEGIVGNELCGWIVSDADSQKDAPETGSPDTGDDLALFAGDLLVARSSPSHDRPDVRKRFGRDVRCGFRISLADLPDDRVHELRLVHERTGYDFRNYRRRYCRKVSDRVGVLRALVYPEWYRSAHGLENLSNSAAIEHFVHEGIFDGLDPCIWFSDAHFRDRHPDLISEGLPSLVSYLENESALQVTPSPAFDPKAYLDKYQDLSADMCLLRHFVAHGRKEGRSPVTSNIPDRLMVELLELAKIEPLLVTAKSGLKKIVRYPVGRGSVFLPRLARARFKSDIDVVVCAPWISLGGADLIATYALRAYQERFGIAKVLLIVTDRKCIDVPSWIPDNTRIFCLDEESDFASMEEKVESLHSVVGTLSPSKIVNVNSNACWEMYRRYGVQLSTALDLYAYLFCFEQDEDGSMTGHISTYVPDTVDIMTGFFCDNARVIDRIRTVYGFTDDVIDKFRVVYTPSSPARVGRRTHGRPRSGAVLWIGRIAHQKRPEILIDIARAMPNERFVVYGPTDDSPVGDLLSSGSIPNIEYRGVYSDVAELDFDEFQCLLNTSAWEGLPTLLIQVMAAGLPIVTTDAGGISELVDETTGWVVPVDAAVSSYVASIHKVVLQGDLAASRCANGHALVERRHCWASFCRMLESSGAFERPPRHVSDGQSSRDVDRVSAEGQRPEPDRAAGVDDDVAPDQRAFQLRVV